MTFRTAAGLYLRMGANGPRTVALSIRGPISRDDLPGLCDRVCALLTANGASVVLCDVYGIEPDAVTVDALARLQLAARRHGCQVRLLSASSALVELVEFMGLRDVLPDEGAHAAPVRVGSRAEARSAGRSARRRGRT